MLRFNVRLVRPGFTLDTRGEISAKITAIFGPSGAGKTTLLRIFAGLEKHEGTIFFNDEAWKDKKNQLPPDKRKVGYCPQTPTLFPHMTVRKNISYSAESDIDHLMELLQITPLADKMPSEISGGQAQRVSLARALATNPRLLLLDEPLAGIEEQLRSRILTYITAIQREFTIPILYVTHTVDEVLNFAEEVLVLNSGKLIASGKPIETLASSITESFRYYNRLILQFNNGTALINNQRIYIPEKITGPAEIMIRADDIILSSQPVPALSARNILTGTVTNIIKAGNRALVLIDIGSTIASEITIDSLKRLDICVGKQIFTIFKASSVRVPTNI